MVWQQKLPAGCCVLVVHSLKAQSNLIGTFIYLTLFVLLTSCYLLWFFSCIS